MNKLIAVAKLTRIEHSVMLMLAVVAAELVVGGIPPATIFVLSLLTPALVSMGAFAINDYFDVEADRANKRTSRPIVAGAISKRSALLVAIITFAAGSLLSIFINPYAFAIAVLFSVLAYLYSYKLKDMVLTGNVYIAFSMVIPFVYGNLVVVQSISMNIILISFVVFLSGLAREIHGMIRDKEGDIKIRRSRNLVYHLRADKAATFALILYLEAVAISLFMFVYSLPFMYNLVYIAPVMLANAMFVYVSLGYKFRKDRGFHDLSRNLSLAGMLIAILAFLFAALFYVYI